MKTRRMIVMLLCVVMIAGMMTGCQKKIPQTAAEFTQIMEAAGLEVRDNTGNGDENDKRLQSCMPLTRTIPSSITPLRTAARHSGSIIPTTVHLTKKTLLRRCLQR